ncbi:MAG: hypothetical protein LBI67_09895 [Treponema sp.]|jgi:hypothetical protein|nr:hypothetical protein [Treponema sp.]
MMEKTTHNRPRRRNLTTLFLGIAAAALFPACSAAVSGRLEPDSSGSLSLKAALEPKTAALIRSFLALQGGKRGPVLDSRSINRSLGAAPGIASAALKNTSPEAIEGTIAVSTVGDFLSSSSGGRRLITYEPAAGRGGTMAIHLDRDSGPEILKLASGEAADYLSVLMAPLATGETLSRIEYLELVAAVYGEGVAAEIAAARFTLTLEVPGTVTSVKGGRFSGRQARFDIPMTGILVLETPLEYEVVWAP